MRNEEPILIKDAWDRILSPEKAAEIKRVLASVGKRSYHDTWQENKAIGRTRATAANANFLLTGRIACVVCGSRIIAASGDRSGKGDRYACGRSVRMKTPPPWGADIFQAGRMSRTPCSSPCGSG